MKDRQGEPRDLNAALQKSEQGEGGRCPLSFCIFPALSCAYVQRLPWGRVMTTKNGEKREQEVT